MRVLSFEQLRAEKGVPYSRQYLSELEKAGRFPRRVQLGGGSSAGAARVGWFEHEIDEHLLSLPRGSSMPLPPWLAKGDKAAEPTPPRTCAYPECNAEPAERTGKRGPQPRYCATHGHRRAALRAKP
jgi:predicted DNA-binding transcriptional regulator AlpA